MNEIEKRINRLEKSARWWRSTCAMLAVALLAALHFGGAPDAAAAVPDVLKVHRLEVVNADGKVAVTIDSGSKDDQAARLSMFAGGEKPLVQLSAIDDGPGAGCVAVQDRKARHRAQLSSISEAKLILAGENTDTAIELRGGATPGNTDPTVEVNSRDGDDCVMISSYPKGGQVYIGKAVGPDAIRLRADELGASIAGLNSDRKVVWSMPPSTQP